MEGADGLDVLLGPAVVDGLAAFLAELPHAANADPITRTVPSTPTRLNDNLMLPPRWLIKADGKERSMNKV
jgi:hypothetical protein